jgi:hypothetical protein
VISKGGCIVVAYLPENATRIYEIAIALDRESTRLFSQISNEETRTPEADQRIRERLKEVNLQCNELMQALD